MGGNNRRRRNPKKSDRASSDEVQSVNPGANVITGIGDSKWSSQQHLPVEILEKIVCHLDVPSLKSASLACEFWRMVIQDNLKYRCFHGKAHTEKETLKVETSDILFIGHDLVILQTFKGEEKNHAYTIRVLDDRNDQSWESKSCTNMSQQVSALASDKIVVLEQKNREKQAIIKSSYGIWSRSGDYISTIEIENIGIKVNKSGVLFLLPDNLFTYFEVLKTNYLKHTKYSDKNDKIKIKELKDFDHPFALVLSENNHLLALKISNGIELVGGVSRKKKSSKDLTEAKISSHFIAMIEKFGEQKDWYACWELNIFDFDGNNLFRTSINEKWGSHHLDGFYDLNVDVRNGRRTVVYRIRNHLRILDLDSLREEFDDEGKVLFEIFPLNGSKRTRDWLNKNSRSIDLSDMDLKSYIHGNYYVSQASITFVMLTKLEQEFIRMKINFLPQ